MSNLQELKYSEAKETFQKFLASNSLPKEIIWLFREDIIPRANELDLSVKVPDISANEALAKECFNAGQKQNLGVCFSAIARLGSYSCCYVLLPVDERDAELKMMNKTSLKCSVNKDLRKLHPVKSSITWTISKIRHLLFGTNMYLPPNMPYRNCKPMRQG